MKLYLIRHGRMAGDPHCRPESPVTGSLSQDGVAQAERLGKALGNERIDAAFSSPYGRALQTAEIALSGRDLVIQRVPGIEEWKPEFALRNATSTVYEEILRRDRDLYAEETWKTEQGEGTFDVYARVVPAFLKAMADFGWHHRMGGWVVDAGKGDCGVAVFAHGGSLSVLLAFILGVAPFPIGRFSFELTGVAKIDFVERHGLFYPTLFLPTWQP
jgi:broad specificity phosphatase PhoE